MNLKKQKRKCRFLTKVKIAREAIEKQLREQRSVKEKGLELISPNGSGGNYEMTTEI